MNPNAPVNWYVQGADWVLTATAYMLIVRFLLDLTFGRLGDNAIFRALKGITQPLVRAVGAITPRGGPGPRGTACARLWVFTARNPLGPVATAKTKWRMIG
jgi:hypothetical protein